MKAKAIVSRDVRQVQVEEVEIGEPGEWDLVVKLETSAISVGTESYVLSTNRYPRPYIPGYAPVGRIVAAGKEAARSYQAGERVSYFHPSPPVGIIQNCGGHQSPALINVQPELIGKINGYCVKVPEDLSSGRAAFGGISSISCLGVSLARQNVGDKALVVGQGMIGQFAAQHLKLRGAEVAVADLCSSRLELARQSHSDILIDSQNSDFVKNILEYWPGGADIVVDTTGSRQVVEKAAQAVKANGKFVLLGWVKGSDFTLETFHGRIFEALFPWGLQGERVASSWRLMACEALKIDHLITHVFRPEQAQLAYDMIYQAPGQYTGILIDWRE